ncbi:hypothetical protein [Bradyrhizobium sp. LMG 9283]|uniref:hypothetical protein n=1 Tax=Bradyrhizobium sp. LMG 9283 TaxID=592064 RepID=UPI0038907176
MQTDRLGNDRNIALEPLDLANYSVESLMNDPVGRRHRIEEALKCRLDHHAFFTPGRSPAASRRWNMLSESSPASFNIELGWLSSSSWPCNFSALSTL